MPDFETQFEQIPTGYSEENLFFHISELRTLLMLLLCFMLFGVPGNYSNVIRPVLGFVPLACFIISGFLTAGDTDKKGRIKKLKRTVLRSAVAFLILTAVFLVFNFIAYKLIGNDFRSVVFEKGFWFDFLVLNKWNLVYGTEIWYFQSYLYASIILLVLEALNLQKADIFIVIVGLIFSICTGELAGITGFRFIWYSSLQNNFLTCALPYLALGRFMRRKKDIFDDFSTVLSIILIVVGVISIIVIPHYFERENISGYFSRLTGMGLIAFAVCTLVFSDFRDPFDIECDLTLSKWGTAHTCYLSLIFGYAMKFLINRYNLSAINEYCSIIVLVVSYGIAWVCDYFGWYDILRRNKKQQNT